MLLKRRGFWQELKRGERAQVRTEMEEFIALPFPFPSELTIWSFHVVLAQWRQRNVQKSVIHVQSCCFAHETYCFLTFPLPSSSWIRKVPKNNKYYHALMADSRQVRHDVFIMLILNTHLNVLKTLTLTLYSTIHLKNHGLSRHGTVSK